MDARVDHKINGANTLMMRFNLDRFYDNNPQDAVSDITLPSAGRVFRRHTWSAQINETSVLGPNMLNEARFEYQNGDPITDFDPLTPSTQYTRAGVVTEGESRYAHVFSRQGQLSDTLSWTRGRHYLKFGGNAAYNTSGGDGTEFGGAFVLGQFTISPSATAPISQLTIANVSRYTETFNFGIGNYTLNQWLYALFAQDSVRVTPDLTLDLGLRYDRQTFSDSKNGVAPRVGFAWHPEGSADTVVRGGYGMYYTMLKANNDASFELNGPAGFFTYAAAPGQLGFPTSLTAVPITFPSGVSLPARNITIRPGEASYYSQFFDVSKLPGYASATWRNPRSQVGSIGFERQLAPRLFVSADYVHQHWTGLEETVDLNAPSLYVRTSPGQVRSAAAADATRPITPVANGFRQISVIENLGVADYNGLQTMLRYRSERAYVSVSYTLSKATNTTEPDGNGAGPNDYNQLGPQVRDGAEPARPAPSRRDHAQLSPAVRRHGRHGDRGRVGPAVQPDDRPGQQRRRIDDRSAGRQRHDRGPLRLPRHADLERHRVRRGCAQARRRAVTLRVEVFNLFNHANILGRNGVYGDLTTPGASFGHGVDRPGESGSGADGAVGGTVRF